MASLTILYWRDIPSQVIVKAGRSSAKRQLSERFIRAIDAAAMHAGAKSDDAYLAEWRRGEPIPCGDDLENEARPPPSGWRRNTIRTVWRCWPSTTGARPHLDARVARRPAMCHPRESGGPGCREGFSGQNVALMDARFRRHDTTTGPALD